MLLLLPLLLLLQAVCSWMEPLKGSCAGIVMTGDLNAPPDEALHATMAEAGFLSAHKVGDCLYLRGSCIKLTVLRLPSSAREPCC
jgi:hypothetical protein